ncbi:uncharacterized protein LOC123511845 [Portunus trituberculatus]|uniref:uncharacterized protein LOC123511845 n=1 Tax=Portunus trituberculatus TaxID=210409 RepID=UPI001E1CBE6F|nr:uncharacterized protein LOC123511845 [Portunus trituberculatus]
MVILKEGEAAIYTCTTPGYSWVSRDKEKLSQCFEGNWTALLDMCDEGLKHLVDLNWDNESPRPLVFHPFFATYTHVQIARQEPWNFTLGSRYHGDAGDSFSSNEGYNFSVEDWWWDGGNLKSLFDKSSPLWMGERAEEIKLYVRPSDYDRERSCPALMGIDFDPVSHNTEVIMPVSRAPGNTVEFNCTKEMWTTRGGIESASNIATTTTVMQEPRRTSAVVECLANATGMMPDWNDTLELPCVFTCPENYNETDNGEHCLRFHHSGAHFGITSAALECHKDGASLTPIDRLANISLFEPDVYYYTATVTSDYGGIAYQPNYITGMLDCMGDGAALAFPQTVGTLDFIARLVRKHQTNKLLTGATLNRDNDWTGGGVYNPSPELVQLAGQDEERYHRLLRVPQERDGNLALEQMDWQITNTSVEYVACQLYGLAACTEDPSSAPDNATLMHPVLNHRYGTIINYSCYPGYFVLGDMSWSEQWAKCSGEMGGWEYSYNNEEKSFFDCSPVEVCNEITILDIVGPCPNVTYSTDHQYLNGSITIICPADVTTTFGNDTQITTCSFQNGTYGYYPQVIPCDVCDSQPMYKGHNISWNENQTYVVGDRVNATCLENYRGAQGQEELQMVCSGNGWHKTSYCHPACPDPVEPGASITLDNPQNVSFVGDTVTYTCSPGTVLPQTFPEVKSERVMTCKEFGRWARWLKNPYCAKLCMTDPPSNPHPFEVPFAAPVISNWDSYTREVGTEVELECTDGRLLPSLQSSMTIECGEDETWTEVDINSLICRRVAQEEPPQPPGSEIESSTPDNYWEGDVVSYSCPPDQMSLTGNTTTTAYFNGSHWLLDDPGFSCHNVCKSDPPIPQTPGTYDWNGWSRVVDTQVELACPDDKLFANLNTSINITCEPDTLSWTFVHPEILRCRILAPDRPPQLNGSEVVGPIPNNYWEGDVVNYRCPPNQMSLTGTTNTTAHFNGSHWLLDDPGFSCHNVCWSDPPTPRPPGNHTWDGWTRFVDTQVELTCPDNYLFANFNISINITCEPDTLNWTFMDPDTLRCRMWTFTPPPLLPQNVLEDTPNAYYWEGDEVHFSCLPDHLSLSGTNTTTAHFNGTQWLLQDPDFSCYPTCISPPPEPGKHMDQQYDGGNEWGAVVTYTCSTQFSDGNTTINVTCHEGNWTLNMLPTCEGKCCNLLDLCTSFYLNFMSKPV